MLKKNKWLKMIIVFLVLSLVLSLGSLAAELKADLEFWCWNGTEKGFAVAIEEFSKTYPGVKIKMTLMGWGDVHTRVLAALVSGVGAPDITAVSGNRIQGWLALGGIKDISDQMKPYLKDLPGSKVTEVQYQGRTYGIPLDNGPGGLFYHADLLRETGISPDDLQTWDSYVEMGKKFQNAMGPDKRWMTFDQLAGHAVRTQQALTMQQGSGIFDKDLNVVMDNEANLRAVKLMKEWRDVGFAHNRWPIDPTSMALLDEDNLATFIGYNWYTEEIRIGAPGAIGEFRLMKLPTWEKGGGRAAFRGGSDVAITEQCPDDEMEAAWKWLEFALLNVESVKKFYQLQGIFPVYLPVFEDPVFDESEDFFGGQKAARFFGEVQAELLPYYQGQYQNEALNIFTPFLHKAIAGQITPEQALKEAKAELIAAMK